MLNPQSTPLSNPTGQSSEEFHVGTATSKSLQQRAHELIPGGCHTYAKGDDQFPENAPGFIVRGEGCHVWDTEGNEFIEYGMGCRAVTLGHGFPTVVKAAQDALPFGTNFTRPAPIEVECAEKLIEMIPAADMAKFSKDGSAATSAAIKLARAHTGRDHIAICGNHPFFASNDWFIGSTAINAGIPQSTQDLTLKFQYNDIDSLAKLFEEYPDQISCVILEPAKYDEPADGFLHKIRELCDQHGAVYILDEMICGFRWHNAGGQAYYDVEPDLSTFGKALANGFSVSALVGKRELMELGGLHHDRERVFLLSTTHGAETHALAAAIETMNVYQTQPVIETLDQQGTKLRDGINQAIAHHGLGDYFELFGKPCCLVFATRDPQGQPSQAYRSLFLQEAIKHGLITPSLIVSYSHSDKDIDKTIAGFDAALHVYRQAINNGVEDYLVGQPSQVVYRKYN